MAVLNTVNSEYASPVNPMLQIGSFISKSRVIQSPMAGCTDLAFRLLARRHGMELAFLEMISAHALVLESKKTFSLLKTNSEDRPLGAQLVGCDPDIMGKAAQLIEERGFDILDINMGCPVQKITSQGSGAALLKDVKKTEAVLKAVKKSVRNIPVTVKIRKGYEDESGDEAVRIAKVAEDCGYAMVTVHGRTRAQMYAGKADWKVIGRVKESVHIPVGGNGDVFSGMDAKKMMAETGCDAVMVGRGSLGNPWLFRDIASALAGEGVTNPTNEEKLRVALYHADLLAQHEGEEKAALHMRRIGAWYVTGHPNASFWRDRLHRSISLAQAKEILNLAFSSDGVAADPQEASSHAA